MGEIESRFCKQYQTFNEEEIRFINLNIINRLEEFKYTHKNFFFEDNSEASQTDYYEWWMHIIKFHWENDIWTMTEEEFQYHWPMVANHISQYIDSAK